MDYSKLEAKLGIKFDNPETIGKAFIHKSYLNENRDCGLESNERLEFLGDAVLELVATRHLFEKYPLQDEGDMTSYRSALVKGKHLAEIAEELELGQYLLLSNGEEKSGGREKSYILANTVEALIGIIYLTHGYMAADSIISKFILTKLDQIIKYGLHIDAKTQLQETAQEKLGHTPYYEVHSESGPDHDKEFIMGAYVDGQLLAEGKGASKQKAAQDAAANALKTKGWE